MTRGASSSAWFSVNSPAVTPCVTFKIGDWQPQSLRDKPCPKQIYGCVSKLKPQQRVQGHLLYALSRENRPRKVAERTIHTSSGHVHDYIGGDSGNVFHKVLILCAILHALKIFRTTLRKFQSFSSDRYILIALNCNLLFNSHHICQLNEIVIRPDVQLLRIAYKRMHILFNLFNVCSRKAFLQLCLEKL